MKVLALDVSTKTGFAFFEDGKAVAYGTMFPDKVADDFGEYPFSYVLLAQYLIDKIITEVVDKYNPDIIVVEESNQGREVYSQKKLEYLHYTLIFKLMGRIPIHYIRTGEWRKSVEAKQNTEEKKLNSKISRDKAKRNKEIEADKTLTDTQKAARKKLPIKIDGKVAGKKGRKHVAIRVAKEIFGVEFKNKDEDAVDALLLGLGYLRGAPRCNGKSTGGSSKKETE